MSYCSLMQEYFESWRKTVSKYFTEVDEYTRCREQEEVATIVLDFEPEEWWEVLEHPSSIFTKCCGVVCNITGDLVVPPQATQQTERLVRSLPDCNHTRTDHHAYSDHVHFMCEVSLPKVTDTIRNLAYITRKSEEVIEYE